MFLPMLSRTSTNQKDTTKRKDRRTIPWLTTPCLDLAGCRSSLPAAGIACPAEGNLKRPGTAVAAEDSRSLVAAGTADNSTVGRHRRSSLQRHLAVVDSSCYRRMIVGGRRVDRIPVEGLSEGRVWPWRGSMCRAISDGR